MTNPEGESNNQPLRLDFDRRLKLEFHGSRVTSDAGLLAYRELDDALGLTLMVGDELVDPRTGKNGQHAMKGLFRQSVFGRLGGYEDVNDADRLGRDPAMRWIVGGRAVAKTAASTSQMGRFETEFLATDENLTALAGLSGQWIDRVHARHPPRMIVLDMDSSVSPTHGDQEGTAYNGHFGCSCYHPLFVFNQFGDLERCALRPGNVHSAHGWHDVLEPVVARYRDWKVRRYFRGDAAFAAPDLYEFWKPRLTSTPSVSRPTRFFKQASLTCSRVPSVARPTMCAVSMPASAIRPDRGTGSAGWSPRWSGTQGSCIPASASSSPIWPGRRTRCGLLQPAGHGGAAHQGRQVRHPVDAPLVPEVRNNEVRLQLHALAYNLGNFMRTLALPKAVEHWSLTTLREKLIKIGAKVVSHGRYVTFPTGGGCGAEGAVPTNPPPHRWAAAGPFAAMTAFHPVASRSRDRTGVCCAGRSVPSQCEMFTGPGFSSPSKPDQERDHSLS